MISVHIFDMYGKSYWRSSLFNWYPVTQNQTALKKHGIRVRYFSEECAAMYRCDVLFLASSHFMWAGISREQRLEFVKRTRDRVPKLIWFDTADSTGSTQFELLPYLDRYLKKQMLKDKTLYRLEYAIENYAADYFYRKYSIDDPYWKHPPPYFPLPDDQLHKLGLSWNIGMYPIRGGAPKSCAYLYALMRDVCELYIGTPHFSPVGNPDGKRDIDLLGLFGTNYKSVTISHQRKMGIALLEKNIRGNVLIGNARLSRSDYWAALRRSKIVLSLFGWGEICFREMEGFVSGAAILMPSVEHLETWPNYYLPHKTYYPIDWDLEGLMDAYTHLLHNDDERIFIAREGLRTFMHYWSEEGKAEFVRRFVDEIQSIVKPV